VLVLERRQDARMLWMDRVRGNRLRRETQHFSSTVLLTNRLVVTFYWSFVWTLVRTLVGRTLPGVGYGSLHW